MAEKRQSEIEEKKIPVFTVLKNNAILKNIFVIDQPPPSISRAKSGEPAETAAEALAQEYEEILMVGRHPECNIVLEHPSISRFHLCIRSKPSSQKLSVTDLSSVHGTWVSGKKIEPNVEVELKEGDTIRIGASSRVYRLHWLPLSRAYDLESPFVPDELAREDGDRESTEPSEEKVEERVQEENSLSGEAKVIEALAAFPKAVESAFSDENPGLCGSKLTPTAPPMPEDTKHFNFLDEEPARQVFVIAETFEELENQSPLVLGSDMSERPSPLEKEAVEEELLEKANHQFNEDYQPTIGLSFVRENFEVAAEDTDFESPMRDHGQMGLWGRSSATQAAESADSSLPGGAVENKQSDNGTPDSCQATDGSSERENVESPSIENQNSTKESQNTDSCHTTQGSPEDVEISPMCSEPRSNPPNIWSRRGKSATVLQLQTGSTRGNGNSVGINAELPIKKHKESENKTISKALSYSSDGEEEIYTPDKENVTPDSLKLWSMKRTGLLEASKPLKSYKSSPLKAVSPTQFLEREGESFIPDEENFSPKALRSMNKMGKLEETKHLKSYKSSPLRAAARRNLLLEKDVFATLAEENLLKVPQERRSVRHSFRTREMLEPVKVALEKGAQRMPFQQLLVNSTAKSKSVASDNSAPTGSSISVNCGNMDAGVHNPCHNISAGEGKRSWTMLADSTCLLNQVSRKSLQLLQGLRGTQLVIPRIVIRELDCLKRRGSLFRRTAEVSSALQWIEECMVNTSWWIHVQSTAEDGRPIAPTPPASPQDRSGKGSEDFSGVSAGSIPFSICGSFTDIVSPTVEDHILEYALVLSRTKNDGHIVLLSDDVTLKIKAMAEGLICETAEEFRESLVNPFSERFLWADSSPRGLTWSCSDDVALKEKYDHCSSKRSSKGGEVAKDDVALKEKYDHCSSKRPSKGGEVAKDDVAVKENMIIAHQNDHQREARLQKV